jgi:hypothetical protein
VQGAAAGVPSGPISGTGGPKVTIPRIEASIVVDGVLDEAPWQQAARLGGFSQYQPADGRPAEEETEVLVWYSPEAIHFGIIAHDKSPSTIRATSADRDNLDREDNVTIYLDTFSDRRRAFFFAVNPLGAQQDGVQNEGQFNPGSTFGGTLDKNPDYRYDSKGRLTPDGYVVEVRIPFKSLRYPGNGPQTWGLNVKRKVQRTGYEDTWTDARRVASFLAQSGSIDGLHDLKRGVVTEVQPFVTASNNGTRIQNGEFERVASDFSAGVNMRLGLTNLSVDATINPDFSQVESDAGLVTINQRFSLFYPEKRPFFLEGIELFATPNQLVYTRQIVDPIAGGKLTGKFGPYGVAYMTAVDDTGTGHALFNVARIRRDFWSNSIAGVTVTDRTEDGEYNRVLAADARVVFKKLYYVLGQLGGSWTDHDTSTSAPVWTLEFDRTAHTWGFNYKVNAIGNGFRSEAGFVPRTNIVEARFANRLSYYGKRGAAIETVTVFFSPTRIWRYADFMNAAPIEGTDSVNINSTLRKGWQVSTSIRRDFVTFDQSTYTRYTVVRDGISYPYDAPEELRGTYTGTYAVTTPTWQKMNAKVENVRAQTPIFPEASEGHETRWTVTASLRPMRAIRADLSLVHATILRDLDRSQFASTTLPRLKIEYQPKRSLFFRMVSEYRAQEQAELLHATTGELLYISGFPTRLVTQKGLRIDWLASYEPTPGTAAYFGYGTALDSVGAFRFNDLRRLNDGFFLKLAYQIRR